MNTFKSIGAVLAGFITVVVLSTGTDFVLESLGIFPPQSDGVAYVTWMLVVALAYRTVFTVAGGYVTALLAPQKPMLHVWILAVIGFFAGTAGAVAGWNLGAHWYPVLLVIFSFVAVVLGGKLKTRSAGPSM